MGHSNGKIYSPINHDDVAETIGVNSYDQNTLCRSANINAQALIQPRYTESPSLEPEDFENMNLGVVPRPADIGQYLTWADGKWGIWLPYIESENIQELITYCNTAWQLAKPTQKFDGTESYNCLDHFDGYDHNARCDKPLDNYTLEHYKNIMAYLYFPERGVPCRYPSGRNDGGAIRVSAVFDKVWLGVALYAASGNVTPEPQHFIKAVVFSDPFVPGENTGLTYSGNLNLNEIPSAFHSYALVPFACTYGDPWSDDNLDYNSAPVFSAGTETGGWYIYPLEMAPGLGSAVIKFLGAAPDRSYLSLYDAAYTTADDYPGGLVGAPANSFNDTFKVWFHCYNLLLDEYDETTDNYIYNMKVTMNFNDNSSQEFTVDWEHVFTSDNSCPPVDNPDWNNGVNIYGDGDCWIYIEIEKSKISHSLSEITGVYVQGYGNPDSGDGREYPTEEVKARDVNAIE